jgi:hypothetical protein
MPGATLLLVKKTLALPQPLGHAQFCADNILFILQLFFAFCSLKANEWWATAGQTSSSLVGLKDP